MAVAMAREKLTCVDRKVSGTTEALNKANVAKIVPDNTRKRVVRWPKVCDQMSRERTIWLGKAKLKFEA